MTHISLVTFVCHDMRHVGMSIGEAAIISALGLPSLLPYHIMLADVVRALPTGGSRASRLRSIGLPPAHRWPGVRSHAWSDPLGTLGANAPSSAMYDSRAMG